MLREHETQGGASVGAEIDRSWRCAACGAEIARDRDRIPLDGEAARAFVNPEGIEYVIAGFRLAPGCSPSGERTAYWSWFPGFAWQIALCADCGAHLGWSFASDRETFYGLVLDRLSAPSA